MVVWLVIGCVAGALATLALVVFVARTRMIQVTASPYRTVDEAVAALEKGMSAVAGWNSPGTRDVNGMLAKHGVRFEPAVRLVEMCKAEYAAEVLRTDRHVATLMPCAVAVYADDRGKVWLSKLNLRLMGPVFGGTVGRVMGDLVAGEEERIFAAAASPASGRVP